MTSNERHTQILNALIQYRAQYQISPNLRELAKMVGLKSVSNLRYHLDRMVAEGTIHFQPRISRSAIPAQPSQEASQ